MTKKTLTIIALSVVGALLVGVALYYNYYNGLRNKGIDHEVGITSNYSNNQNYASNYTLKITESLGVADRSTAALNKVLTDAVKGRYDGNMEPGTTGSMFSAITEAYPDLTANSEVYAKVQDEVIRGRNDFAQKQTLLLDRIAEYDKFRDKGIFQSGIIASQGFPSARLKATSEAGPLTGAAALEHMRALVLDQSTVEAFTTNEAKPLIEPDSTFGG